MKLSFPSQAFPAFPSFALDIPAEWESLIIPSSSLAARAPTAGHFRPNVVVTLSRFGATYDLQQAILALKEEHAQLPEAIETVDADVDVSGFAGYAHEVTYRHAEFGTLVQSNRITVVDQGPVRDLVLAVGSCAGDRAKEDLPTLRAILKSLTVARG
jgi:hypothetical protein